MEDNLAYFLTYYVSIHPNISTELLYVNQTVTQDKKNQTTGLPWKPPELTLIARDYNNFTPLQWLLMTIVL